MIDRYLLANLQRYMIHHQIYANYVKKLDVCKKYSTNFVNNHGLRALLNGKSVEAGWPKVSTRPMALLWSPTTIRPHLLSGEPMIHDTTALPG